MFLRVLCLVLSCFPSIQLLLVKIVSQFSKIKHLLYADDTQVYITLTPENAAANFDELKKCLSLVQSWMSANRLKLNPDKTEFILFGSQKQLEALTTILPVNILGSNLMPSDTVRNLGVKLDSKLDMSHHILEIARSCHYHMKDLRRIRRFLPRSVAITLANSLVGSKIDYCNSLFHGIKDSQMRRLQ